LLIQVSERLQAAFTESELVARLGGDELTVLSSVDAHTLGVRIQACFDQQFVIEDRSLLVTCSAGVAAAGDESTPGSLMRNADTALYAAKGSGGGQHQVFGRALRMQSQRRVDLKSELHTAILNGDIVPWLQPIVDLNTGEIVAAEALARWQHVDGVRSAVMFIDELREIGMMSEFTEQLVHTISEFQSSLRARGVPQLPISINIPSSHLQELISHAVSFPLAIEITEETAISDIAATRQLLRTAQAEGHRVWLDDFGTGFSSMSVAAELPIDGIKIDGGFVSRLLSSPAVVGVLGAMVDLADRLSLEVVAEGVELKDQARVLREFGITMAQGHLWSPAVPLEDFAAWLQSEHRFSVEQAQPEPGLPLI